jgi:hypothetical protein
MPSGDLTYGGRGNVSTQVEKTVRGCYAYYVYWHGEYY